MSLSGTDATYDELMFDPASEEAKKVWETSNGQNDEKSKKQTRMDQSLEEVVG